LIVEEFKEITEDEYGKGKISEQIRDGLWQGLEGRPDARSVGGLVSETTYRGDQRNDREERGLRQKDGEQFPPSRESTGTLEGVSTDDVQGTGTRRDVGAETGRSSAEDRERNGGLEGPGVRRPRGPRDSLPEIYPTEGRERGPGISDRGEPGTGRDTRGARGNEQDKGRRVVFRHLKRAKNHREFESDNSSSTTLDISFTRLIGAKVSLYVSTRVL